MNVIVNGERREVLPGVTVAEAIGLLTETPQGRGMAVALGGEVVPRGAWSSTTLTEGAQLEIVSAIQGG